MCIKIKENSNIPKQSFGKNYEIVLTTCPWSYRFRFSRKKHVYLIEMNKSTEINRLVKTEKRF